MPKYALWIRWNENFNTFDAKSVNVSFDSLDKECAVIKFEIYVFLKNSMGASKIDLFLCQEEFVISNSCMGLLNGACWE